MEVVLGSGDIATKEKFGDVQLHVVFAEPAEIRGNSQNRGNSGIFMQGRYETQVLDGWNNPTYADGQVGAIYGQWPPLANPSRKPGEWQTYDIVFEAPKMNGETVIKPAYVTVFLNGVLMHVHKELLGPTVHRAAAKYLSAAGRRRAAAPESQHARALQVHLGAQARRIRHTRKEVAPVLC
jgi:hypothetical protein